MQWLVRLVTPPGGVVLDPFAGVGATAEACVAEQMSCIAVEREGECLPLIRERIARRRSPDRARVDEPTLFDVALSKVW